jgi:protein-tyrosine sulfotransferase
LIFTKIEATDLNEKSHSETYVAHTFPKPRMSNADSRMSIKIPKEITGLLRVEARLWKTTLLHRTSFVPLIPLAVALGYLIGPWDIIPASVPYFGHLDEVTITILGVLTARVLIPAKALTTTAGRIQLDAAPSNASARFLTFWLILQRRLMRSGVHTTAFLRRTGQRMQRALRTRQPADIAFSALGYRSWWRIRSILARRSSENAPLVVLGGSPRSGTTLLRTLLGRHSQIVSGPETTVFLKRISAPSDLAERLGWDAADIEVWQRQSRSQAEFIERFGMAMRARSGKPVWLEKTPRNVGRFGFIRRHFPQAKLVHIVRDGRDVVCSLRRTPFARLDHAHPDSVEAALRCGVQWQSAVEAGLRMSGDENYHALRYEDLVSAPEQTLRKLLLFLGLPWEDTILEPTRPDSDDADAIAANGRVFNSSHGRWQRDLSAAEKPALGAVIGPTLVKLGYATDLNWARNERAVTPRPPASQSGEPIARPSGRAA